MEESEKCKSAHFTLCFTVWKRRDLLRLDGAMRNETSEEVQDGVITSSQVLESSKWIHFNHSGQVYSIGSLSEKIETMQPPEQLPSEETNRSVNPHIPPIRSSVPPASLRNLPLLGGHVPPASLSKLPLPRGMPLPPSGMPPFPGGLPPLSSGNPGGRGINLPSTLAKLVLGEPISAKSVIGEPIFAKSVIGQSDKAFSGMRIVRTTTIVNETGFFDVDIASAFSEEESEWLESDLDSLRNFLEINQEASKFRKKARVFNPPDSTETWASRWVASPIAYLFPEIQQEEWLGDLHETNYKMLLKGRHRWELNINNTLRTIELIESALRVKLSEWVSVLKDLW